MYSNKEQDIRGHVLFRKALRGVSETSDEVVSCKAAATQTYPAETESCALELRSNALLGPTRTHSPTHSRHPTRLLVA